MSEWTRCQEVGKVRKCQKGGIYNTKKRKAATSLRGPGYENLKPRLESGIFKCASWLKGSFFFGGDVRGFQRTGMNQDLRSLETSNIFLLFVSTSIVYGCCCGFLVENRRHVNLFVIQTLRPASVAYIVRYTASEVLYRPTVPYCILFQASLLNIQNDNWQWKALEKNDIPRRSFSKLYMLSRVYDDTFVDSQTSHTSPIITRAYTIVEDVNPTWEQLYSCRHHVRIIIHELDQLFFFFL
jgi:hypothetical protein